jgi:hypothetical protein
MIQGGTTATNQLHTRVRRIVRDLRLVYVLLGALLARMPAAAQDLPGFFVEVSVDNAQPYVGQQVRYTFRLFDAVALDNPLYEPPTFEGFWRVDLGDVLQFSQVINGQTYNVTELRTTLFPTRSGEIVIDPSRLVLPATVFEAERSTVSNALTVQVRPLPDGAPVGFTGAVGQFTMDARLDRDRVPVGESITLELTIRGDGNVEQMPALVIASPDGWRMVENPPLYQAAVEDGVLIGRKTFAFVLIAEVAGSAQFDPITLHYFDPLSATYRQIGTGSIAIAATANPDVSAGSANTAGPVSTPLPLKISSDGAVPASLGTGFWLLWLLPPSALAAVIAGRHIRRRISQHQTIRRKQDALQMALRNLDRLSDVEKCDRERALKKVIDVLNEYVSAKLCRKAQSSHMWWQVIENANVPEAVRHTLSALAGAVQEGMYAPAQQVVVDTILKRIRDGLAEVDVLW